MVHLLFISWIDFLTFSFRFKRYELFVSSAMKGCCGPDAEKSLGYFVMLQTIPHCTL